MYQILTWLGKQAVSFSIVLFCFYRYKWAFIGEMNDEEESKKNRNRGKEKQLFYPHVIRIVKHMRRRVGLKSL